MGSKGFVLVAVLWITSLLAAMSLSIVIAARSHALRTRNVVGKEMVQGVADGLVRLEAFRLANRQYREGAARPAEQVCSWEGRATAWISIRDQAGLVDLNTAAPELMRKLLEGLGLPAAQAAALQQAIADFRDEDGVTETGAAEPATYPGKTFGPKNRAFAAVEELDQIPGVTEELRARISPYVTVHSQQPGIDVTAAPAELLRILKEPPAPASALPSARTPAYGVSVAVAAADGSRFLRRAIITLTQQPDRPFAVLLWAREAWPEQQPAPQPHANCF